MAGVSSSWEDFVARNYPDLGSSAWDDAMAHQQAHSNFIMQAGMQNQLGAMSSGSTWTSSSTTYVPESNTAGRMWFDPQHEQYHVHIPLKGEPGVPQYIWKDGKMENIELYEDRIAKLVKEGIEEDRDERRKWTKEDWKVEVKLTLSEARHLEEACEKDPELKDILAKIEEEVDFTIVVSFRDDKSK